MAANDRQVGGDHYKTEGPEHWDLCARYEIGYLEGCATKYILRWRRKSGIQDLEKALHYIQKRLEYAEIGKSFYPGIAPSHVVQDLCRRMDVGPAETLVCLALMSERRTVQSLRRCIDVVQNLITDEKGAPHGDAETE